MHSRVDLILEVGPLQILDVLLQALDRLVLVSQRAPIYRLFLFLEEFNLALELFNLGFVFVCHFLPFLFELLN